MFFETPANIDFAGYADDNTPYTYSSNIKNVLDNLQGALEKMFHWFSTNNLVANECKFYLLTSSKTPVDIYISNSEILNEERVKLLGVNLEGRLNFDFHVNTLLKKAIEKVPRSCKSVELQEQKKQHILINAFITYQFSCCPLARMSYSATMNNRINKIREKL